MSGGGPRSALRAFAGRYLIALVLAVVLTGTAVATVDREITDRVSDIKKIPLVTAAEPPEGANFLMIGSDSREFVDNEFDAAAFGSAETERGRNSDTLMVAHIEPGSQRTLVVSFPRDLLVDVPGLPGKNRINAAYGTGGEQAVIDMLKANFDIDIHHFLEVNFKSFGEIVDTIGNVNVYFPFTARDQYTNLNILFPGCYPLDGDEALKYVRSRYLEYFIDGQWQYVGQDAPDLHRIERQQEFIRKLAGLAISKSLGDPFVALDLSDEVLQYLKVDAGTGRDQVNELIRAFRTVDVNDPEAVQFETVPTIANDDRATLSLGPDADAMLNRLRTFGGNTPRAPEVQPSQVTVRVLDGNGRGEAAAASAELARLGFATGGTGTGRSEVAVTEVRYPPALAASAKLLLSYFTDARLVPDPDLTNRLDVVLGGSFAAITVPTTTTTTPPAAGALPPPAAAPPAEAAPAPPPPPETTVPGVTTTTDPRAAECV